MAISAKQQQAMADLIAKQAIGNALAMHSRGVDRADLNMLASAYHTDATVDYGFFQGPALEFVTMLANAQKGQPVTLHRTSNMWIKVKGKRALSESYVIAYLEHLDPAGATQRFVGGRYLDTHEERQGEWRLTHRTYVMDWNTNRPSTANWPEPAVALSNLTPRGSQGQADAGRALLAFGAASFKRLGDKAVAKKPTNSQIDVALSKQALHELCAAYARGVDRCDADLLRSIFHKDATVIAGVTNTTGEKFPQEITAWVGKNLQRTFHTAANTWFEVDGDDAIGESYVIATMTVGGNDVMTGGRYLDTFQRRKGVWKFKSRSFVVDWTTTAPTTHSTSGMYDGLKTRGCYGKSDPIYAFWK
jgi:hypothetical protein